LNHQKHSPKRDHLIIQTAATIITYYEQNQVSLRNAMKIFPTIEKEVDSDIYSQVHAIVFETVRYQTILNRIIHLYIQRFLHEKIPSEIRNILRVITYLLTLDPNKKEPNLWEKASLEILESVNLPTLSILFQNYPETLKSWKLDSLLTSIKDNEEKIAVQYSHPTWLVRDFLNYYGLDLTLKILKSNNQILPIYLRLNLIDYEKGEIIDRLNLEDVEIEEDNDLFDVIKIISWKKPLPRLPSFKNGMYYIQNKGSSLISHILDPQEGELILDACAAPGGKTTHIASLQHDKGTIIALDNHIRRMYELLKKIRLFNLNSIHPIIFDLRVGNSFQEKFSKILVDAPCSGSGTFSSRPDSKWRIDRHQTKWLSKLQYSLLENASSMLKDDTYAFLIYSTCSLHPLENENVIELFLHNYPEFQLKTQNIIIGTPSSKFPLAQRLFPHLNHTEGFSIFKIGWNS